MNAITVTLKHRFKGQQRGFGLVEIMISLLLVAIMFNGLMDIFLNSRATFSATDNITRRQENGRSAVQILMADLRRSGYLGGNSDITTIAGSLGPSTAVATCVTNDTTWARMISWGLHGLDDTRAGYDCVGDDYLRGDIITMRFASPWQVASADFVSTRIYLRSSLFEGKVFLGADTADKLNAVLDTPQRQHELLAYTYYIADTGRTCNGAAVPGLFREALNANNFPLAEELIAGVENMQFQYNIGNRYVDADNVTDWSTVLSVKMWVLVRSECPETGFTDVRTYVLGDLADYTPADAYRRSLYSTVVALRN